MTRWIACAFLMACAAPLARSESGPHMPLPSATAGSTSAVCASASPYAPIAAWSGAKPDLPVPPTLSTKPMRVGDAYTVFGAVHALHSRFGAADLQRDVTIEGYIVDTNLDRAPKCALHKTGIADPFGCRSEIPTFTIADESDDRSDMKIRVMGWASDFSNVFEAYVKYKSLAVVVAPSAPYIDTIWKVAVPYPLPAVGAKVRVTGRYASSFTLDSSGIEVDPDPGRGILTLTTCVTMELAPKPASFPQLRP